MQVMILVSEAISLGILPSTSYIFLLLWMMVID